MRVAQARPLYTSSNASTKSWPCGRGLFGILSNFLILQSKKSTVNISDEEEILGLYLEMCNLKFEAWLQLQTYREMM